MKEVVKLENTLIKSVEKPEPGNWEVYLSSSSSHTLKMDAVSKLDFRFGFSHKPIDYLEDTKHRPYKGI